MLDNTTVKRIPTSREDFYFYWVEVFNSMMYLSANGRRTLVEILNTRARIAERCSSEKDIDSILFSSAERAAMAERLGMTAGHFRQMLTHLRKCGALKNNSVSPILLPHKNAPDKDIFLLIQFEFNEKEEID